ncbi:MAG TPA: ABC transporter permease [Opitutaceae bacterium]|nr:ABC transporter permease [Opitutaceae bacterium]
MRTLLVLLRKDAANFCRDRTAFSLTFIVPIALIYIFGFVFGLNRKGEPGPRGIALAVVDQSGLPAAQKLVAALKAEKAFRVITTRSQADKAETPLTEPELRPMMHDNQFRFAVVLPPDLIRRDGIGLHIIILSNPRNDIETQMVNGLLQKTIFSSVPELLGQSLQFQAQRVIGAERMERFNHTLATTIAGTFGGDAAEIERSIASGEFGLSQLSSGNNATTGQGGGTRGGADALASIVKIESVQVVGKDVKSPEATRVVGGWAMMFLLFALNGSASAFFDEKKTGIFQRLLSAPVSRAQLLWSRFLWGVLLGLVQLTTLFLAGRVMYGIDVFGHFGNLVVICIAAAAACTAFGMLIAAITPSAAAASGLATFLIMVMSACGGAWFPISLMPPFMQQVGKFTLVYWAMEGFSQVLWAGNTLLQILPTVGVLLGIAAGVMALALWRFNRGNLFG